MIPTEQLKYRLAEAMSLAAVRLETVQRRTSERDEARRELDKEQSRWQNAIDAIVLQFDPDRDGSGCESGDPLDLTLTEIRGAFGKLEDDRDEARRQRDKALDFIQRQGYRRCDIIVCNCNSWHGGHAMARLQEIQDALPYANGPTILARVQTLRTENAALRDALTTLEYAADPFLADQSRAQDPRCGLTQPVSVADCEALNAAVKGAREVLEGNSRA